MALLCCSLEVEAVHGMRGDPKVDVKNTHVLLLSRFVIRAGECLISTLRATYAKHIPPSDMRESVQLPSCRYIKLPSTAFILSITATLRCFY
jgi:hypothetical protein